MYSTKVFEGYTFYIPATSGIKKVAKQLQARCTANGAYFASVFSDKVTHAVVTQEELNNRHTLIDKALKKGVAVVSEMWLDHMLKNGHSPVNPPSNTILRPSSNSTNLALQKSNAINNSLINQSNPLPILSLMLPQSGPNFGNFKIAVFGKNFIDSPAFRIRVGHLDACNYEFHGSTSVVATIPASSMPLPPGETLTGVSNDGGASWSQPLAFSIYDPSITAAPLPPPAIMSQGSHSSLGPSTSPLAIEAPSSNTITPEIPRAKPIIKTLDREIRLFISSPFVDMQEERDTIVKTVVPKLRKLCMERDVAFSYVDLRWGVTAAQNETATSLLLCLREIDTCNLFVGFYGERYGWCISPERDSQQNDLLRRSIASAAKEYPWVSEMSNLSMSEIEMRMVIDKKYEHGDKNFWFYLRDPYYLEEIPEKDRHIYRSESDRAHTQLEAFKRYLTTHSSPRNYSRPADISELVFEDVKNHIDREYPSEARLGPVERERFRHNVYTRSFTHCYLPNEVYFNRLDKHVSDATSFPLVVSGESGIGKTALLSNWILRHNEHVPEDIVIHHWVGCSPHSSSAGEVLSRILLELRDKLEFHDEKILPKIEGANDEQSSGMGLDTKKVMKEFLNSIKTISSKYNYNRRRIVLVIDGLDKIDARENAHDLIWLPRSFPKSVRVIFSCSPCFVLDVLKKRKGTEFLEIQPMAEADRKAFIRTYLTHRSKRLSEKQEFLIAQSGQTSHPLYLKTLLDDLSEFGKFEQLDSKIASNLQAANTAALYDIVLRRLEDDHDRKADTTKPSLAASSMPPRPAVPTTSAFLSLLWGARRGLLLQSELNQLLSVRRGIPEELWMDFFIVADETLLADCSGLLLFANNDVRKAVSARYLKNDAQKEAIHKELASFFESIPDLTERKVEELPYQYTESRQWEKLKNCLCDLAMFDRLYTSDAHKFDLLRYWRTLETHGFDVVESYKVVISRGLFPVGLIVGDLIFHIGRFLLDMDKNEGAEFMLQKAEAYYHQASQMLNVAKVSASLGELYFTQARHEECEKMLLKSVSIYEKEKGPDSQSLVHPLDRLGVLYTAQAKFSLSREFLERALHISEANKGADSVESANVIYNLACNYLTSGDKESLEKAESFLLRALNIKESNLGPWDVEVSHVLLRLGAMYLEQDQFADAEECFLRSLTIREAKLGPEHSRVAQCLKYLITCYEMQEMYSKAIEVGLRALAITKKVYGEVNFHTSGVLLRIGTVYLTDSSGNNTSKAKQFITDALNIRKKLFKPDHHRVLECQKILDSMIPTPVSTPLQIPLNIPPPPPQMLTLPKISESAWKSPSKQLLLDSNGVPVGPPPPPPVLKAPTQQVKAHVTAVNANEAYLDQLQNFSKSAYLAKADTQDRSDAQKQAITMLGARERKIQFKKSLK